MDKNDQPFYTYNQVNEIILNNKIGLILELIQNEKLTLSDGIILIKKLSKE